MTEPAQGEIWWATAEGKRRPVLVVTRDEAIPVLTRVLVAPVTKTVRRIPTEISLGPGEGLDVECAATFDNLQPISKKLLTSRTGKLGVSRRGEICAALAAAIDC